MIDFEEGYWDYKLVIFDMDGVIVDTEPNLLERLHEFFQGSTVAISSPLVKVRDKIARTPSSTDTIGRPFTYLG